MRHLGGRLNVCVRACKGRGVEVGGKRSIQVKVLKEERRV